MSYHQPKICIRFIALSGVLFALAFPAFADMPAERATASKLEREIAFDIAAQPLDSALLEFSRQANVQVMLVGGAGLADRSARAVKGRITAKEALASLLENTGFSYTAIEDGTVTIKRIRSAAEGRATPDLSLALARTEGGGSTASQVRGSMSDDNLPEEQKNASAQEIVVTAQKRRERLQDVPVPVTVLSAQRLVDDNKLLLQDYYTQVPGLSLTVSGQSTQALSIRGITTGIANPSVGITIDDVPYGGSTAIGGGNQVPDIDPGDLARVEVLRGPQGTLYGASSMGGLLKFVTADPSFDAVSGRIQGGVSTVHAGNDLGYNLRGSINVPLGDAFAVMASAFTRQDPGYIDNIQTGKDDINRADLSGGRLSALWRPSDRWSLKVSAMAQQSKGDGFTYVHAGLGDLQQSVLRGTGGYDRRAQAYSAHLVAQAGRVELTSVTGYNINEIADSIDNTVFLGGLTERFFGVPGSPAFNTVRTSKLTQEVRATLPLSSRVDWLLGAFYTNDHSYFEQNYRAADPATGAIVGDEILHTVPTTFREYAAFTSVTFKFGERFDVQVGGRESRIEYSTRQTDTGPFVPLFFGAPSPLVVPSTEARNSAFTYLLTPRLKITPDLMMYARMASGYRAGGINGIAAPQFQYSPDKTYNYEIGLKGEFLDRRLTLDASVYYIDWKAIQLNAISPAGSYLTNGSRAKSQGVELALAARPLSGLSISAWVALGNAELTEDFPNQALIARQRGDRLPFSSRTSGNLTIEQTFPLTAAMSGFVGAGVSYIGNRPPAIGAPGPQIFPTYTRTDLRAGLRYGTWVANVFVNNVADKRGILATGYPSGFVYVQPRTAGLSISKSF